MLDGLTEAQELELIALLEEELSDRARASFSAFRAVVRPDNKRGWWQAEIEEACQAFYEDFAAGKRPTLIIEAPPQHGKSTIVSDFLAWLAGKDPDLALIYASKAEMLGTRANLYLQRLIDLPEYARIFPETKLNSSNVVTTLGHQRNQRKLEFVGHRGSFRNVTIEGSVNGESMNIGIIDDPVKDRAAAKSKLQRDSVWDWFTDVFNTRMDEKGGLLIIMTRWDLDDLVGRVREKYPKSRVISYPAIAEVDEKHRKAGEALFPEHKSIDFILERKNGMSPASFQSLYKQNPLVAGGEMIKGEWLVYFDQLPEISHSFITADTALTAHEKSDYSVFQLWGLHQLPEGGRRIVLIDMIRGRWEFPDLKAKAVEFTERSMGEGMPKCKGLWIEDKASGISLIQDLKRSTGIAVNKIKRTNGANKEARVDQIIGQISSGNVMIPRNAVFTYDLVDELLQFPNGMHDDQVDPLADAINIELNAPKRRVSGLKPMRATHV